MNKLNMIQELETNFMTLNNHDIESNSKLWLYDLLGFVYAHISDEQLKQMLDKSNAKVWQYEHDKWVSEQEAIITRELAYEIEAGK